MAAPALFFDVNRTPCPRGVERREGKENFVRLTKWQGTDKIAAKSGCAERCLAVSFQILFVPLKSAFWR